VRNRKRYFVSINKETIMRVSVPDADEYEIYATEEEITNFRRLLATKENSNFWFTIQNLLFDPLAASENELIRDEENENLKYIYQFVYHHGTEETKEKIRSLGIIRERMTQKLL